MWETLDRIDSPEDFIYDPSLVLYLPLYRLDGASFMSKDAYGHLCTVTGATWGSQGRTFNKIDNKITIPDHASLQNIFDTGGSIGGWIKPNSSGEGDVGRLVDKSGSSTKGYLLRMETPVGGSSKLVFYYFFSTTYGLWATTDNVIPFGTFTKVNLAYNSSDVANSPTIYINGVSIAVTTIQAPVGTRISDVGADLIIGNEAGTTGTFDGIIGEVPIYNRALSIAEFLNNYLVTKWRYS